MAERLGMQALADAFELLLDMREGDRLSWLQEQDWCLPDKARLRRMLDADSNADACFMDAPALVHAQILDDDQAETVGVLGPREVRVDARAIHRGEFDRWGHGTRFLFTKFRP